MGKEFILSNAGNGNAAEKETAVIPASRERQSNRCSDEKRYRLKNCVDKIRSRFGNDSIRAAAFIGDPPEKRRHGGTKSREYW